MSRPKAVIFTMLPEGHFRRLRPLISGLVGQGVASYVYTHAKFRAQVERAGGTFVDLFEKYSLEGADNESGAMASRYVTFAGSHAEEILRHVEKLEPSLVVYDTFAVIGRVVARSLGLPYVNVCAGHNVIPGQFAKWLAGDPRWIPSAGCLRAAETLRDRYGLEDASPFAFDSGLSPFLNIYCEPAQYLTQSERRVFEPIAFYGSLPAIADLEAETGRVHPSYFKDGDGTLKVYVSFGTTMWRYWIPEALDALGSISRFLETRQDVRAVISLGRAEFPVESVNALRKHNVSVTSYVDQWKVLQEADVFITHHGLNSTHEAIYHGVPMMSYPFAWDQPGLAEKCRSLGLTVPLGTAPLAPLTTHVLRAAFAELERQDESLRSRLAEAREWEWQAIRDRDSVHERIVNLIGPLS